MNCDNVTEALISKSAASRLPPEAQEHLERCDRCRELVRALNGAHPSDEASWGTLNQIEQRLLAELRVVQPVAANRNLSVTFAAIFVSAVSFAVYRLGAFAIAVMSPFQAAAILGALAISVGLLTYSLVHQMVPGSRHLISPKLLPAGIVTSLMVAIVVLFRFQRDRDFWTGNWACLRAGMPISVLAGVIFWLVLCRGAILSPSMTGAATGMLAGLVGTSALEVHCPNLDAGHILVSHLGIAVLCSMAGLVLGLVAEIAGRRAANRPKGQA